MKPNPLQDIGLLLLRIGLGLVTLYYGCQLLMGTFGGEGFTAALDRFHEKMGIPIVFGTMCVIAESFGALAVIVGLLTRLAAIGLAINFGAAVYFGTHRLTAVQSVFLQGKPDEAAAMFYPAVLCIAFLSLAFLGAGRYALDARLFKPRKSRTASQ